VTSGTGLALIPECRCRTDAVDYGRNGNAGLTFLSFRTFTYDFSVTNTNTSSMDVQGVSISTAISKDLQGVTISAASSMDVQGVPISTASSMDVQMYPFPSPTV
jgi:hypothetical protein